MITCTHFLSIPPTWDVNRGDICLWITSLLVARLHLAVVLSRSTTVAVDCCQMSIKLFALMYYVSSVWNMTLSRWTEWMCLKRSCTGSAGQNVSARISLFRAEPLLNKRSCWDSPVVVRVCSSCLFRLFCVVTTANCLNLWGTGGRT